MTHSELKTCPLCGSAARVINKADGSADHLQAYTPEELVTVSNPISPVLDNFLRAQRKGKKTVAIVGAAWTSRSWAPYNEPGVEIWCFNEMHGQLGVERATRWFQLHHKWIWSINHRYNHCDWLMQSREYPLYMQKVYDNIPGATAFPLREIKEKLLTRGWQGEQPIKKVFTSSMAYAVALALYENFERIELFGIELTMAGEYAYQRESLAYWLGKADGMGVEWWMPESCELLRAPLYAYEETRKSDGTILSHEISVEDILAYQQG